MGAYDEEYGTHFGKHDLERIGLFAEMPYMNGKGYVSPFAQDKKDPRTHGLQMMIGVPKVKTGLQDCYFDQEFHRLFIKEAWIDPVKIKRAERLKFLKKRVGNDDFIPPSRPKKPSGSGDYYGTFGGPIPEFSPITRKKPPRKKEPPSFFTNPGKKGGPTYPDICFSKYPEHSEEFYGGDPVKLKKLKDKGKKPLGGPFIGLCYPSYIDPVYPNRAIDDGPHYVKPTPKKAPKVVGTGIWIPSSPAKKDGGRKDGALNKWPQHLPETAKPKTTKEEEVGIFYPQARNKTMYTQSIAYKKIDISCNNTCWRSYNLVSFPDVL